MAPSLTRVAVLIVDDDALVRLAMRRALSKVPEAQIDDFSGGRDALAACRAKAYDVAIFDLEMPEMNGVDLAQAVRAILPSIRIAFVSAGDSGPLAERARAMSVLLPKPWPEAELLRIVRG